MSLNSLLQHILREKCQFFFSFSTSISSITSPRSCKHIFLFQFYSGTSQPLISFSMYSIPISATIVPHISCQVSFPWQCLHCLIGSARNITKKKIKVINKQINKLSAMIHLLLFLFENHPLIEFDFWSCQLLLLLVHMCYEFWHFIV